MLLTLVLAITIFLAIFFRRKNKSKLPPGPPCLPILGCLPFVNTKKGIFSWTLDHAVTKHKLATVMLGPKKIFVINDFKLAKELFGKEEFSGRGVSNFHLTHKSFNGKPQGIVNTEGKHWVTQRRFSLKTLKDFGFGKQSIEEAINIEVDQVVSKFLEKDEDTLLSSDFNVPMINILWQMVAGKRFTEEDEEGMEVVESVNDMFKIGVFLVLIPLAVLKMFPKLAGYEARVHIYEVQKKYIMKEIEKHQETIDPEVPRDFIDVYLNEIAKDVEDVEDNMFNKEDLAISMMDFLAAGTETSSTTLKWLVLYLTINQETQEKYEVEIFFKNLFYPNILCFRCREEISKTLGTSACKVSDMTRLPFIQVRKVLVFKG